MPVGNAGLTFGAELREVLIALKSPSWSMCSPIALRICDDYTLGQMKLTAQHDDLRIFPGIATYTRAPMGDADMPPIELPIVLRRNASGC